MEEKNDNPEHHSQRKHSKFNVLMNGFRRSADKSTPTHQKEANTISLNQMKAEKTAFGVIIPNLTPHQIAREGDVLLMEKLLDRTANTHLRKKKVNSKDDTKLTPLHYAVRYFHYEMMKLLINNGADLEAASDDGSTPLHIIAKHLKRKELEVDAMNDGVEVSDDDKDGEDESSRCLKLLIDYGSNLNSKDFLGMTPLHQACVKKNTTVVKELLKRASIDLEAKDHQKMTPLHLACLNGRKTIVKLLLEAGARLRARDKSGATPFHYSCVEGNFKIAESLLDKADQFAQALSAKRSTCVTLNEKDHKPINQLVLEAYENFSSNLNLYKTKISGDGSMFQKINLSKGFLKKSTSTSTSKSSADMGLPHYSSDGTPRSDQKVTEASAVKWAKNYPVLGSLDLLQDTDEDKNIALHFAIENGHLQLVKLCIDRAFQNGWNDIVHVRRRSHHDSCLHLAVQSNSLEIVELLVKGGADINVQNSSLVTPLMLSCQHNAFSIVQYLLNLNAKVELKDSDSLTALLIACRYGRLEVIDCLLKHGADVTETDKDDKTCLMWAAEEDRTEAIALLLSNQEIRNMIEERNKHNNTALHLASMKGHGDTVKLLLDYQAAADLKNDDDKTTLHMAAQHGHDFLIPLLISKDRAMLTAGDEESNTALHLAAIGGNLKSVNTLIQAGAHLGIRNASQWTPLDCAAAYGWKRVVQTLLESGASVQPKNHENKRNAKVAPLLLACQRGHVNVVKLLLQWNADVTFRSLDGRNALDFAIDFGHKNCALTLIKHHTWKESMRNAVENPVSGKMLTPMRKLIMKMDDVALVACNQCMNDNGKKPETDDYEVTVSYEFLDDMYASTEWMFWKSSNRRSSNEGFKDEQYTVYDENDLLTPEAETYSSDADELQSNHPLKVMVDYKSESLLLHPLISSLLHYKWRRFGRYVFYSNLLLYITYMILLNVYMQIIPLTYQMDWVKILKFRQYLSQDRSIEGLEISSDLLQQFTNATSDCLFFRIEVLDDIATQFYSDQCNRIDPNERHLRLAIFALSIFNLFRAAVQFISQKLGFLNFKSLVEVALYILSLLLTIDFSQYEVTNIRLLTDGLLQPSENQSLSNFQYDTGLRLDWQEQLGALAIFLSWMELLLYIRMIPKLGLFVVMFTEILKTFAQFFIVFAFFILAFSLSFSILLGNQPEFQLWYEALVKTTVMTIGELDYVDLFFSASLNVSEIGKDYYGQVYARSVSLVAFTVFLIVMTIIIMNLLVGLAVGDIIEIQKNATLQSLGMQVALTLEVEFTIPSFLRKSLCRKKQVIKVNKYRNANLIKKFFFHNSYLSLNKISKALDKEEAEQDETRTTEDKVMVGLNLLRDRLADVIADQGFLKKDLKGIQTLVWHAQMTSKEYAMSIKENITQTKSSLTNTIDSTRSGLTETTHSESSETRSRVGDTQTLVNTLKNDLECTRKEIGLIKHDLEQRMIELQTEILNRFYNDLQLKVTACKAEVEESKKNIMSVLEGMKMKFLQEKFKTGF